MNERDFDTDYALNVANNFFRSHCFNYDVSKYEIIPNKIYTTRIIVNNYDVHGVALQGNGKGIGKQSLASAMYETIEHYLFSNQRYENSSYFLPKQILFDNCGYVVNEFCKNKKDTLIECAIFNSIDGFYQIYHPLALLDFYNPKYINYFTNSKHIIKYLHNSGSAVGLSLNEAILHALNEVIERDALSIHFIECFLLKRNARVINKSTLPARIKELIYNVERFIDDDIKIINITSDTNVPSYLAYITKDDLPLPISGYGCSLNGEYALERAILEMVQIFHLYDQSYTIEDYETLKRFESYKNYSNILKLEYSKIAIEDYCYTEQENLSTGKQIKYIDKLLTSMGYRIFYNYMIRDDIYYVNILIPGFENFNIVNDGLLVVPQERGYILLNEENYNKRA